jgi:predicted DNA-binding protein (MmcQ/YjbR family)
VNLIERVRTLCLALPESFELEAWDHPTFRLGSGRGKIFCTAASDGSSITVKAEPVEREALLTQGEPFYRPPYVGRKGLVGIRLDHARTDWQELAELITTSYRLIAPKRLAREGHPPTVAGPFGLSRRPDGDALGLQRACRAKASNAPLRRMREPRGARSRAS